MNNFEIEINVHYTLFGTLPPFYLTPNINLNCDVSAVPTSVFPNFWTGSSPNGIITYNFSEPVLSARVTYSAVNLDDSATISINSPGLNLSNPCGVSIVNNQISASFNSTGNPWTDIAITVSSNTPFTQITLTNTGGNSGFVSGFPCNFILELPNNGELVYDPKVNFYFCSTSSPFSTSSILDNVFFNGGPASSGDIAIIPIAPFPPFPIGMSQNLEPIQPIPWYIQIHPDGTVEILENAPLNFEVEFYIKICVLPSNICSIPIRCNISRFQCRLANLESVKISPNPSTNKQCNLIFDHQIENLKVEIYDIYGVKKKTESFSLINNACINLNDLHKGTYILKLIDGENSITRYFLLD